MTFMGRNMFGPGPGPWGEPPWKGWWDDDPPYHGPVFVLTHHARDPWSRGDHVPLRHRRDPFRAGAGEGSAGGKDVPLAGGATSPKYLTAGLIDELEIAIVPVLLGGGTRLFE